MTSETAGYAHAYATAILRRGREPMPPADFTPNWGDAPRRGKYYPDAVAFPLPDPPPVDVALDTALRRGDDADEPFTTGLLGGMLRDSYGLLGRRLGVQANTDLAALPSYAHANWHRGTASGGGLYPCSVYWIAGPGAGVLPGVYYYAHARQAMQRLLAGDVTGRLNAALGRPEPATQFLVIGVKFWQNAFKYNNFSYHAVSMDVGTLLQTWRLWAGGQGRRIRPVLWFDQAAVADLLGLDPDAEALFAVVPLTWADADRTGPVDGTPPDRAMAAAGTPPDHVGPVDATPPGPVRVRHADRDRSRTRLEFDLLRRINRSTAAAVRRPPVGALAGAGAHPAPSRAGRIPLPPAAPMDMPVGTALARRRSSFGRFLARRPITAGQLAALLRATAATRVPSEIDGPSDRPLAKLYAFVNHVDGVPARGYEYDPVDHALIPATAGPPGEFLQRNYFLANYNLEQAAVVLVPTVRTHAVLDATGDRGYNLVNATVGAISQTFYTAAAALRLGAGVALGFDSVSYVEELALADTGEFPLLIMLAGHDRPQLGDYRYELS
ncbi:nitroreductase family protein [Micromonospora sp. WMMD1128]|uniref:nitroreductase family protein n=1 Tax=Micromonospora sp. WMMD1128 TaxID=3015150 RepID=UPI00248B8439|nr:nitroreductase family protein [Micromonospora sp. WMMD1128]WBB71517.1 nitroreductase family protein [Micromonospora sp. WMMD1128]